MHSAIWVVVKIYSPFWGTLNNRCRIIIRTPKGTIILTTTHIINKLRNAVRDARELYTFLLINRGLVALHGSLVVIRGFG